MVFGSAIKYIELSHGRDIRMGEFRLVPPLQGNFLEFLPRYFTQWDLLTWSHLWFLAYLYLISLLMLPLLVYLAGTATRIAVPAAPIVYLPALILAAHLVAFDGYWPFLPSLYKDGANFFFFAWCFAIGAGIAVWPGFETRLRSEAPRLLISMLVAFAGVIYCGESDGRPCVRWCDGVGGDRGGPWLRGPHQAQGDAGAPLSQRGVVGALYPAPFAVAGGGGRGAVSRFAGLDQDCADRAVECDDCARILSLAGQALSPHAPDDGHVRQAAEEMTA